MAAMSVVHAPCAGLDVHKKRVVACVVCSDPTASEGVRRVVKTFGTMTDDLEALARWLADEGVTHVAMEATGV